MPFVAFVFNARQQRFNRLDNIIINGSSEIGFKTLDHKTLGALACCQESISPP
jgi:hypothetical protein